MYHVFLGAPSIKTLAKPSSLEDSQFTWTTISSPTQLTTTTTPAEHLEHEHLPPPATLEAASRRISLLLYQNALFRDDETEQEPEDHEEGTYSCLILLLTLRLVSADCTMYCLSGGETLITWPPTPMDDDDDERSKENTTRLDKSRSLYYNNTTTRLSNQIETQETQESQSYNYSDTSSIARFPKFHFNLHILSSLSSLVANSKLPKSEHGYDYPSKTKVNVLLAVLEVEGPDVIRTKKGVDAGKEISLLRMILGDEDGTVCKLTAWRETAEVWGGSGLKDIPAKRGDVVLIQNVTPSHDPSTSLTLTASPNLKSKLEICYRTMPYTHEDLRLRPDLRLGGNDASVRKVAGVVRWFEGMAGI
ncbi:hypothetical protein F5880DRAFT_1471534 [Lentinula raphanica]|nr:hypothetical protein F5880DRAFT_1471534 [Lentinula raphanica]